MILPHQGTSTHGRVMDLGRASALAGAALIVVASAAAAEEPPAWLVEAARAAPDPGDTAHAVILLLDYAVEVHPGGRIVTRERGAIRIVDPEGREEAVARVHYRTDAGRVQRLAAWVLPSSGPSRELGRREETDVAVIDEVTYSESRVRMLDGTAHVETGSVFGWEWAREEKSIFTHLEWQLQPSTLPCRLSRFSIELPDGWQAQGRAIQIATVTARVEGDRHIWEARDLPQIADEPARPPLTSLAPILLVSWSPRSGSGGGDLTRFTTWTDVAAWLDRLTGPMRTPTPETAQRAGALVRGAKTEVESLRAVARFAQSVRYASIPMGLHRGGGYKPNPAGTVLTRTYGDCKDKANLLRSLLESVGVESRLVAVYSGDAELVKEDWPSPSVFNHCILAVRTRATLPTTLADSSGRRWTFFDPTDPATVLGDLPAGVQGARALVMGPDTHAPLRLPRIGPDRDRFQRRVTIKLDADGTLGGHLEDRALGQMGRNRRALATMGDAEQTQAFQRWLAATATGARVTAVDLRIEDDAGTVRTDLDFDAPRYAQLMRDRLMVFRPFFAFSGGPQGLSEQRSRHWPVDVGAWASFDTVTVSLPPGFKADELPESVTFESPFGRYATTVVDRGADVRLTRELVLQPRRIPAAEFTAVRDFFSRVKTADRAPVVLARE